MNSMRRVYAFAFTAILLHNLEEALTAPAWLARHAAELQTRFGIELVPAADAAQFHLSLAVLTFVILLWIAAAARAPEHPLSVYSVTFLLGIFVCNAFVPHILGALLLRRYVPGAATAAVLVIPVSVWWTAVVFRRKLVRLPAYCAVLIAAVLAYVPILGILIALRWER